MKLDWLSSRKLKQFLLIFLKITFGFALFFTSISCSQKVGDFIFDESGSIAQPSVPVVPGEPTATTKEIIVITSQDTNHRGVSTYEIDGTPLGVLVDFRAAGSTPRGILPFDFDSFLVGVDGADAIYRVFTDGTKEFFHISSAINGALFDMATTSSRSYILESNRIEAFDTATGASIGSAQINTTTGACVLSAPRGMVATPNDELIVASITNDMILVYDVTLEAEVCDSAVFFGNAPYGVLLHSDGFLYITTQDDDRVYKADPDGSNPVVVWDTNTTLINNPSAIFEMANGDLLVASSATDTIERITTAGVRVGTVPFIRDVFSLNTADIQIIEVNE